MLNWTEQQKLAYIKRHSNGSITASSYTKELIITFDDETTIDNDDIVQESLSITKSFSDNKDFHIGNVGAAEFRIQIINRGVSYRDRECDVKMRSNGVEVALGHFIIVDDDLADNRIRRTLKGYDRARVMRDTDITEWYEEMYPNFDATRTVKELRDGLFAHFGFTQETKTLPNDNVVVPRGLDTNSTIKGETILNAICEINAVFGSFNGSGVFTYKNIARNSGTHFDSGMNAGTAIGSPLVYRDYVVEPATKVQVRSDDADIGGIYGSGTNTYVIGGNVLAYGLSADVLSGIAHNVYNVVSKISFTPTKIPIPFIPWYELGDWIRYDGTDVLGQAFHIYSPILKYELSGIQGATLVLSAEGSQKYPTKTESVNSQLFALRSKSAKLTQEIGEVSAILEEQGVYPLFYPALATDEKVKYPNNKLYPTVSLQYTLTNVVSQMIADAESSIMLQVSEELENYDTHEASLQLWVGRNDNSQVISMINASADVITLNSNRLVINSTNFKLSAEGNIQATSGDIGGWDIGVKGLYNDANEIGIINTGNGGFIYGGLDYEEAVRNFDDPQWQPSTLLLTNKGEIYGSYINITDDDSSTFRFTADSSTDTINLVAGDISLNDQVHVSDGVVQIGSKDSTKLVMGYKDTEGFLHGIEMNPQTQAITVGGQLSCTSIDTSQIRVLSPSLFFANGTYSGTITYDNLRLRFVNGLFVGT